MLSTDSKGVPSVTCVCAADFLILDFLQNVDGISYVSLHERFVYNSSRCAAIPLSQTVLSGIYKSRKYYDKDYVLCLSSSLSLYTRSPTIYDVCFVFRKLTKTENKGESCSVQVPVYYSDVPDLSLSIQGENYPDMPGLPKTLACCSIWIAVILCLVSFYAAENINYVANVGFIVARARPPTLEACCSRYQLCIYMFFFLSDRSKSLDALVRIVASFNISRAILVELY